MQPVFVEWISLWAEAVSPTCKSVSWAVLNVLNINYFIYFKKSVVYLNISRELIVIKW